MIFYQEFVFCRKVRDFCPLKRDHFSLSTCQIRTKINKIAKKLLKHLLISKKSSNFVADLDKVYFVLFGKYEHKTKYS